LPYLSQPDFDHLLWSSDLNFVRGEDSLVRAIWAGTPFVWQAYPQHDGAHHAKLEAMLGNAALPAAAATAWRAWNGLPGAAWPGAAALADPALRPAWQAWRERLQAQASLATQLLAFATARRAAAQPEKP
jgi:uncharacterized repeat protein (TIGR03837 family)